MYWNLNDLSILELILSVNSNIRCIEINSTSGVHESEAKVNSDIRCIEILYFNTNITLKR